MPQQVLFGINVDPAVTDPGLAQRLAGLADRTGLDLVGMQDHPYRADHLDSWTLLSTLAAQTQRVRFMGDVLNLPLRPPAMLAKAVASLDVLTGGRVELGIGAGAVPEAIAAMGGPRRGRGQARAALSEAIELCRLLWSERSALHYRGEHYQLAGVHPGPRPAHQIGIWIGAVGPRALELIGRQGDGWIASSSYVGPQELAEGNRRLDRAATEAGRNPASIRRIYNVLGHVGGQHTDALHGPVDSWVDTIKRFREELSVDTLVFWPEQDHEHQCELFANEVVPAARDCLSD